MPASPLKILIAIHYATTLDQPFLPQPYDQWPEPQKRIIEDLRYGEFLVEPYDKKGTFVATQGLKFYVEKLCEMPMPQRVWKMPKLEEDQ